MVKQGPWGLTLLAAASLALSGCQSPSLGGLAFWNKDAGASATPDVRSQKYGALAQDARPLGQPRAGTTPLGGQPAATGDNFLTASWKKTSTAVGDFFAPKQAEGADDPLRLDSPTKKVGPEVYVAAARLLENQNKHAEAEEQYVKALAAAPGDLSATVGLARLHDRQGNSANAVELYHKAISTHPTSALAYNDLGLCYARQRQLDKSIQAMGKAVQLQPDSHKYRNNLATVLVEAGRTDEALREMSVIASPAVAHYNVGYLLKQKGQVAEAMRHLQQALAIDPTLAPAEEMLAQLAGQSAKPLAQSAPQAAQPANTYGSPYGYAGFSNPSASISDQPQPPITPPTSGSSFRIADDEPSTATSDLHRDYYGAPRHLPPVE